MLNRTKMRTVRKADIPKAERDTFERFGENVIGAVLAGGLNPRAEDLQLLYRDFAVRLHARDWLTERSDLRERREALVFWVEVAVLVFVILGVIIDAALLRKGF